MLDVIQSGIASDSFSTLALYKFIYLFIYFILQNKRGKERKQN